MNAENKNTQNVNIRNANIATPYGVVVKDIFVRNGLIVESEENVRRDLKNAEEPGKESIERSSGNIKSDSIREIDASGLWAIPGLVDIHFHGAIGSDFCDTDEIGLKKILEYEASNGIVAVMPTTMTFPEETLNRVIDNAIQVNEVNKARSIEYSKLVENCEGLVSNRSCGADIVGIHMEGPFINSMKAAAQNAEYVMAADIEMFRRLYERSKGIIRLVDVAPEVEGNLEFIEQVRKEFKDRVRISLAHTDVDYKIAKIAFEKGASHLTHTFNAMNGIKHREPGPIPAARESGAYIELISDGVHIHDSMIRMIFDLFDEDKIILISDSMMATGLDDGVYMLGDQEVEVCGNLCTIKGKPDTIAGSNTNLYDCMKHAIIAAGVPMWKAIKASSLNPAKEIGVDDKYGDIKPGCYGNIILADKELNIVEVIR